MSEFTLRDATVADNAALLALTRATPMPGTISIRVDRDPDFFRLLRLRGDTRVFVAARGDEVAGCVSAAITPAFVSGRAESVGYVGDLKVHPRFAGNGLVGRLMREVIAHLAARGVDLVLSVVAHGNERVMRFYDAVPGRPMSIPAGRFLVEGLIAWPLPVRPGRYRIDRAEACDLPAMARLLDRCHRTRDFAPELADSDLASGGQAFVARAGEEIVATLALFDPVGVKSNVLVGAPWALRGALALFPVSRRAVPRIGEALRVLYARRFACADGHAAALAALLRAARIEALRRRCTFVTLALHERDPLRAAVRRMPRLTFSSQAFVSSLRSSRRLDEVASRIQYEDFALV